jgi:hypothetical protein
MNTSNPALVASALAYLFLVWVVPVVMVTCETVRDIYNSWRDWRAAGKPDDWRTRPIVVEDPDVARRRARAEMIDRYRRV